MGVGRRDKRGPGYLFGAKALRTRTYLFPDEKVFPRSIKTQGLKIHQRFHFASALKRMSVLASYEKLGSTDLCYIAAVKGAPETLHSMVSQAQPRGSGGGQREAVGDVSLRSLQFAQCPPNYHHIHTEISREGARVLALGYKELGHLTHQQVRTQASPLPDPPSTSPAAPQRCCEQAQFHLFPLWSLPLETPGSTQSSVPSPLGASPPWDPIPSSSPGPPPPSLPHAQVLIPTWGTSGGISIPHL